MRTDPDALTEYEIRLLQRVGDRIVYTVLGSPLSYSAAIAFARYDQVLGKSHGVVIYALSRSTIMDESSALVIREMIELSRRNSRYVILCGVKGHLVSALRSAGIFELLSETQCFEARRTAIEAALAYCQAGSNVN